MSAWAYFVRTPTDGGGLEQRRRGHGFAERDVYAPVGGPVRAVPPKPIRALRASLRVTSRLLYAAPLLVVLQLALVTSEEPRGNYLIVAFVGVVVSFFVVLIAFVLATSSWWMVSGGRGVLELSPPFTDDGQEREREADIDAMSDPFEARVGAQVRVVGRARRISPTQDEVLVRDYWAHGRPPWRGTMASPFLVEVEGRPDARVVVSCRARSPIVIAAPREITSAELLGSLAPASRQTLEALGATEEGLGGKVHEGPVVEVREGDEVEVLAAVATRFDNLASLDLGLELPRGTSGYRETTLVDGVHLSDPGDWTVRIRVISRGNSSA